MYIDMSTNDAICIQTDDNTVSTTTNNIGLLTTSNGNSSGRKKYKTDTKKQHIWISAANFV